MHWQLAAETAQARQKHRVLHRQRQLLRTQVQTEETQEAESAAETTADTEATEAAATLEDGTYTADFNTDSSMFQVNEMYDGKGTLTVEDGKMTIHITLRSTEHCKSVSGTCRGCTERWSRTAAAGCGNRRL